MIEKNIVMAEDLGARTRVIETNDPVAGIADAVLDEHATLIVMRHIRQSGWRWPHEASIVDKLLDRLDNVDIHLVEATQ